MAVGKKFFFWAWEGDIIRQCFVCVALVRVWWVLRDVCCRRYLW